MDDLSKSQLKVLHFVTNHLQFSLDGEESFRNEDQLYRFISLELRMAMRISEQEHSGGSSEAYIMEVSFDIQNLNGFVTVTGTATFVSGDVMEWGVQSYVPYVDSEWSEELPHG